MKISSILFASLIMPSLCMATDLKVSIEITNPLEQDRTDCPVALQLSDIAPDMQVTSAVVVAGEVEIPSQLDDLDRDDVADELAFVIDMASLETKRLYISLSDTRTQTEYEPRVWAGFFARGQKKGQFVDVIEVTVPGSSNFYNYVYGHGPMFESELVGYRVYFNEKQTLDPYGKFQPRLELKDCYFYPTDEQLAEGFGDDVLLAGNSCGIGAFKGWDGKEAVHIKPVKSRTECLVAKGPVRTIVEVDVDDWEYKGRKVDMKNRYTLYAGHRDLKVDAIFRNRLSDETFATGVERIMGNESVGWSDGEGLVASWGKHWPVNDTVKYAKETIGIATYVPKKYIVEATEDPNNFLYVVNAPGDDRISYYTMFTSRKETFGFADFEAWKAFLPLWRDELESPLTIRILSIEP